VFSTGHRAQGTGQRAQGKKVRINKRIVTIADMEIGENTDLEKKIIGVLKTIYDPEIPVNIYDLGLIYEVRVDEENKAYIKMTLTAPNCPIADQLLDEVRDKTGKVEGIVKVDLKLTFNPPWNPDNLSDEVKLELGFL